MKAKILKSKITPNGELCLIVVTFLALSIIYVWPLMKTGILFVGSDRVFHLDRLEMAYQSVRLFKWPESITTYGFGYNGQALGIYYPDGILILYGIIRAVVHSKVISYYLFLILGQFFGLLISYYSAHLVLKSKKKAYVFALLYRFSAYVGYNYFPRSDLGETWAQIFIPLALVGLFLIVYTNKKVKGFICLSLGMILITYSHLLSTILTICLLFIVYLITVAQQVRRRSLFINLKYILISISIYVMATLFFWYPLIRYLKNITVVTPDTDTLNSMLLNVHVLIENSLDNKIAINTPNIGLFLIVITIVGWVFLNSCTPFEKTDYLLGVTFTLLATNLFPWVNFGDTPIVNIQYPWRLLIFATLFLALFGAQKIPVKCVGGILIFTLLIITVNFASFSNFKLGQYKNFKVQVTQFNPLVSWSSLLNENNYTTNMGWYKDYIPKNEKKSFEVLRDHKVFINGKSKYIEKENILPGYQNIEYRLNKIKKTKVTLPFLIYFKNNYRIYLNGEKVGYQLDNSQPTIKLKRDYKRATIKIVYRTPFLVSSLRILSLMTIVALTGILFFGCYKVRLVE